MRDVVAPEGPIMQFFSRILDMAVISILFTLTCIPIVTIGLSLTSLYYAIVKAVYRGEGHIIKAYCHCFRVNIKQGLCYGILLDIVVVILLGNLYLIFTMNLGKVGVLFGAFFVAVFVGVLILSAYGFPVLSRFEVRFGGWLQTCLQISVTHGRTTFQLVVMEGMLFAGMVFALVMFPPLIVIWPGLITYAITKVLDPVLQEYMPKEGECHETEII